MFQCPKCRRPTRLQVTATVRVELDQKDNRVEVDRAAGEEYEWDDQSPMVCMECSKSARAEDFFLKE